MDLRNRLVSEELLELQKWPISAVGLDLGAIAQERGIRGGGLLGYLYIQTTSPKAFVFCRTSLHIYGLRKYDQIGIYF